MDFCGRMLQTATDLMMMIIIQEKKGNPCCNVSNLYVLGNSPLCVLWVSLVMH